MSSQQTSWNPWMNVDVFRSLARFNLPKQLPRRPSVPKSWAFLPRQWPQTISSGFGLGMNLLATQNSSTRRYSRSRSSTSLASYDSCLSTVGRGRPSFDQAANYGVNDDFDTSSSCSSSSYSELHFHAIYCIFAHCLYEDLLNGSSHWRMTGFRPIFPRPFSFSVFSLFSAFHAWKSAPTRTIRSTPIEIQPKNQPPLHPLIFLVHL